MLRILERFGLRDADRPVRGLLDVAKDRSPSPLVAPLQPDTVRIARDHEVIDLRERSKPVLEGIIGHGHGRSEKNRAANKSLALVKGKFLPVYSQQRPQTKHNSAKGQ